jgi:DUF1680 family protein
MGARPPEGLPPAPGRPLELRLRVPRWCEGLAVNVNGRAVNPRAADGRLVLRRTWRAGDEVRLRFRSSLRLVRWPVSDSPAAAIFDGPLCLGLCNEDGDVDAPLKVVTAADDRPARDADGRLSFIGEHRPVALRLRPIGEDWQSPAVDNPHRLRVLFGVAR